MSGFARGDDRVVKKTARLFALAEHLRARRTGVTAEQLAERFGVTVRTIYRDLDVLRDASMPLAAERGRGGGYALDRSYSLPPVNFTAREAALLVAAGRFLVDMRVLPFIDTLGGALDKVRAALPTAMQRELDQQMKTLEFVGVPARAADPEVRRAVERAWFERRHLRIRYRDADGVPTTRVVRLAAVVMDRAETFLNCDDLDKSARRQFRLDRIEWAGGRRQLTSLLLDDDLDATVVGAALRRRVVRDGARRAEADRAHAVRGDAVRDQIGAHALGAALGEHLIRRLGALRVRVALDDDLRLRGLREDGVGHVLQTILRRRQEIPFGRLEEHAARQADDDAARLLFGGELGEQRGGAPLGLLPSLDLARELRSLRVVISRVAMPSWAAFA